MATRHIVSDANDLTDEPLPDGSVILVVLTPGAYSPTTQYPRTSVRVIVMGGRIGVGEGEDWTDGVDLVANTGLLGGSEYVWIMSADEKFYTVVPEYEGEGDAPDIQLSEIRELYAGPSEAQPAYLAAYVNAALAAEGIVRDAADDVLQANIDGEAAARAVVVTAEETARMDADTAESAARIAADASLAASQAAGSIGFSTKALMDANLAYVAGTLARVTNDVTPANNATYLKSGASGAGAWTVESSGPLTLVQTEVAVLKRVKTAKAAGPTEVSDLFTSIASMVDENITSPSQPAVLTLEAGGGLNAVTSGGVGQLHSILTDYGTGLGVVQIDIDATLVIRVGTNTNAGLGIGTGVGAGAGRRYAYVRVNGAMVEKSGSAVETVQRNADATIAFTQGDRVQMRLVINSAGVGTVTFWKGAATVTFPFTGTFPRGPISMGLQVDGQWRIHTLKVVGHGLLTQTAIDTNATGVATLVTNLAQVATVVPAVATTRRSVPSGSPAHNGGTFTGWSSPIGVWTNVEGVGFYLRAWDPTDVPANVRVILREVNEAGAILADKTVAVTLPDNIDSLVRVQFAANVVNAGNVQLWLAIITDGHTGSYFTDAAAFYPVPPYPIGRFTRQGNISATVMTNDLGTAEVLYVELYTYSGSVAEATADFAASVAAMNGQDTTNADDVYMPTMPALQWAAVGQEFNMYWDNIILTPGPERSYGVHASIADLDDPADGRPLEECLRCVPALLDVGDHTLTLKVYDRGVLQLEKSGILRVADPAGAVGTKKILLIGDSLTAHAEYSAQMLVRATADPVTAITMLGTLGDAPNKNEGRGGWAIADYNGDTANVSPFESAGVFNFGAYQTANSIDDPDLVIVELGTNDIKEGTVPALGFGDAFIAYVQAEQAKLEAWITSIHASAAACRIGICMIPAPARMDGWGNVAEQADRMAYVYQRHLWNRELRSRFEAREAELVYLVPTGTCIDTRYGFAFAAPEAAFEHSAVMLTRQFNSVHPATPGYYQMGDVVYAFAKSVLA